VQVPFSLKSMMKTLTGTTIECIGARRANHRERAGRDLPASKEVRSSTVQSFCELKLGTKHLASSSEKNAS
jgi:hypothetical protein